MLKGQVHTGRFVVRGSQAEPGEHSLSVLVDGSVRHIRIRRQPNGGVALREQPTEREVFVDVLTLVQTYFTVKMQLKDTIPFYLVPDSVRDLSEV